MYLQYYLEQLGYSNLPKFLIKYLKTPSLLRLKDISYFCGMDYASKDIYNFSEFISRYDHSLTVSLIVYKLTKDKKATLAGLFHDIATPCFSHVIDYMNQDYEKQESTGCDGPKDAQEDETDERSSISQVGEEDRQEGENGHDFWSHYFPEEHDGIYSLGWLICRLPADVRRLQVAKMESQMYTSGITRESDKSFILECD